MEGKIQEYLVALAHIKAAIKSSIQNKNVTVSDSAVFADYPGLIDQIPIIGDEAAFAKVVEKDLRTIPSVPERITYIPDQTFKDYEKLGEINLPGTVNYIGVEAFANSSITDLKITGSTKLNIREKAFANCTKLQKILITGTSIILGEGAFTDSLTTNLTGIRIEGLSGKISTADLLKIKSLYDGGTLHGLTSSGETQNLPALLGTLTLTEITDNFSTLQTFFASCGLTLIECPYTDYWFDDTEVDTYNITNEDNKTGYYYNKEYQHSGHIDIVRKNSCPCAGKVNAETHKMHVTKLSKTTLAQTAEGETFDLTDANDEGYDIFIYIPHYWYKGVNDLKNEKKHFFLSGNTTMPQSTSTNVTRLDTTSLLWETGKTLGGIKVGDIIQDSSTLESDATMSIYKVDITGMAQIRFPGYEHETRGSVFTDGFDKVIKTYTFKQKSQGFSNLGDFDNTLGDYIFLEIPQGATYLYFNCLTSAITADTKTIITDSYELEAIEPDWVEHKGELVGLYQGYAEGVTTGGTATSGLRSISGKVVSRGNNTATTNTSWEYNSDNNPIELPATKLNGTCADFLNLARYRTTETGVTGGYYSAVPYETSKDIANLVFAWMGTRDVETLVGRGTTTPGYTTGVRNNIPFGETSYHATNQNNKIWGLECWTGTVFEWEDKVCYNYENFNTFLNNHWPTAWSGHTYDSYYKILQQDGTERSVKAKHSAAAVGASKNFSRVRFGRYCDIVVSAWADMDTSFLTGYAAGQLTSTSVARVVGRSNSYANAYAGVACSYTNIASTSSVTYNGARLCFSGEIENEDDLSGD